MSLKKVEKSNLSGGWNELRFTEEWSLSGIEKDRCIVFNDDELEQLRDLLGAGRGDCDHCAELIELRSLKARGRIIGDADARLFAMFKSGTACDCSCVDTSNVISHDMMQLNKTDLPDRVQALDGGTRYTVHVDNHKAISICIDDLIKRLQVLEKFEKHTQEVYKVNLNERICKLENEALKDVCMAKPCEFVKGVAEQGDQAIAGYHVLSKCIDDLKVLVDKLVGDIGVMKFAITSHLEASHEQDKQDEADCTGSRCGKAFGVRPK
jgi:hypothetical protein